MVLGMKTVTDWYRKQQGWECEPCYACFGTGMVSDYGCGYDFYGPKECGRCLGRGEVWKTPKNRYVLYPGGPFC